MESAPTITIERNNIVPTLLDVYKSNFLSMKFVKFIIQDELAQDLDGVKREIYSIFWDDITNQYFEGGKSLVPRVGPDVTDELCKILGRALIHSFLITGIWPIQISKLFSIVVLGGEESLTDDDFLDAFLDYVLEFEAVVLQNALTEAESGVMKATTQHQVLEVLSPFGLRMLPTHSNIKSILVNIAKCELVQKVNRSINKFREGIQDMDAQILADVDKEDVLQMYDELPPTPTKVLSLIKADVDGVLTKSQEEVFCHLKRYVNAADTATLKRFIRFVTGSSFLVAKEIKVIFHLSIARLPCLVAHTCGCTVDLPVGSYTGFLDFKTQLDNILCNPESWKFRLV
ncbi:uncharacterized protein LOC114532162 [Dendronephthya gigantea]|uniref:uncharacterized protein LOC114532162 n=1 Tax=Dendronephthya gigantea TaxID=151771 RepID=UPI00106BD75F|nr:uncharacterized protein LOC114532162 [Dendronephthya gigantea]